jgi:hypothetical protein
MNTLNQSVSQRREFVTRCIGHRWPGVAALIVRPPRMATPEHKNRSFLQVFLWSVAALVLIVTITLLYRLHAAERDRVSPDSALVEKLKSAKRFRSQVPAQRQTIDLAKKSSIRHAALNAIGMELREVRGMANGNPESVFAMLSHLGGFGEIMWVDQWTNFPVKLPATRMPGQVVVPRRDAVRAALDAIEASGGCLIKAGESRYLVARAAEKEKYEAAIRALGWLEGSRPPWVTEVEGDKSNAEPCAAANPAIALWLQSKRLVGRVAELGSLGRVTQSREFKRNRPLECLASQS